MRRLIIVYNPMSSRYADVKSQVLDKAKNLEGILMGKYEIKKIGLDKNVEKLAEILNNGDMVVSAGGDATGVISVNAIVRSGRDAVLAVLPFGNFNDLSRTLGVERFEDVFGDKVQESKLYPLEIKIDGELFRYATCYVTVGMMAESVKIYDTPDLRRKLKTRFGREIISYVDLAKWYFGNRRKKVFLPQFYLNGALKKPGMSDYIAVNGRYMAKVLKGGEEYCDKKIFRRYVGKLTRLPRLVKFMATGMMRRVPGEETVGDVLEFVNPAKVEIQAEGEYKVCDNVKKIEIKKGTKYLKVVKI